MSISLSFIEDTEKIENRQKCLEYLGKHQVDVGLTSKASGRSKFLLAIHTHGAPVMRIPPRPVVQPALHQGDVQADMQEHALEACEAACEGDLAAVSGAYEAIGQAGVDGIHKYIDAGIPPPNSPVTLSGGWIYNRVAHCGVYVGGKSGSKPLIDTGQLYNDFDFDVVASKS